MKGLVFTEFMDMVETAYGLDMLEHLLNETQPASGGAYTTVGTYDHNELVAMLACLSNVTQEPLPALLRRFGESLFGRFAERYPEFFEVPRDSFEFLATVENTVHTEVRKLYQNAELPSFDYEATGKDSMTLTYRSCRPFGDLAEGLIAGCGRHFGETIDITREDLSQDGETHIRFGLQRRAA